MKARELLAARCDVVLEAVDGSGLARAFGEHDVVWVRLAHRITRAVIGDAPRARVLACPATGIDHIELDACAERGIRVVSLKGEVAFLEKVRATAELTIGLMLSLLRHIPAARADVIDGRWDRDRFRGGELFEKTVGVVGLGRLGRIVARVLRAMGGVVVGFDPRADFPHAEVDRRAASLEELLGASDVVTLHVAFDATTRHLMDEAAFAAMKPGALLVNTSRGGIVDESALLRALESGRLGGAALDVLEGEPSIGAEHPVVKAAARFPNLLVTPHIGGSTHESLDKVEVFIAEKVLAALDMRSA